MRFNKTILLIALLLTSYTASSKMHEKNETTQSVRTRDSSVTRDRDRVIDRDTERKILDKENTGLNKTQQVTAQMQTRGTDMDVEVTRKLRERLMADDQLSTNAQNIKIVTVQDAITLTGPVANREEKVKIENYARTMAGKKKVYNRLTY